VYPPAFCPPRLVSAALLSAALLALLAACATAHAPLAGQRAHTAVLAAGDADSLAAAAFLGASWEKAPEERVALMARASAAAPERADLVWLHLQICRRVPSCRPQPIEARLQQLDPGNAAAWSGELERGTALADPAQVQATLATMGNAEHFDIYWNTTIVHLTAAIAKAQSVDLSTALVDAIGVAAAEAVPAYQQIGNACTGAALDFPETLAACRRLSAVLRRGDTYLTEMVGLRIAQRVWPEGGREYQDAMAARRVARYRMDTYSRIDSAMDKDSLAAQRYLDALAVHRTEQEVFVAQIVRAGLDPNPGEDWTDTLGAQ
jgi:hypothetical protein